MKATITITGQISSSHSILNRMSGYDGMPDKEQPNTIILHYQTKQKAYADIRKAYNWLKQNDPTDWNLKRGSNFVCYDAATAKIN